MTVNTIDNPMSSINNMEIYSIVPAIFSALWKWESEALSIPFLVKRKNKPIQLNRINIPKDILTTENIPTSGIFDDRQRSIIISDAGQGTQPADTPISSVFAFLSVGFLDSL